jgi:hypothetical protein
MRARPLVIAGAILLCLASYYICFEMRSSPEGQQEENQDQRLFIINGKDIIGMTIQGSSLIVLEKYGSMWRIIEPEHFPADQAAVNNLISEISNLRIQRTLKGDDGLAQFGLDHPSLNIILQTAGRKYILSIGDKAPASNSYYAKMSVRSGIFLLSGSEKQYLVDQGLFALRDKHLVTENLTEADRVRITRHGMIAEYARDREGIWRFFGDNTKRLSVRKINEFIREVCSIEALGYHDNPGISRGPDIVIELSSRRTSQKIKLWVQGDKAYAVSDVQKGLVEIDPSFVRIMPEDPMEMLDRTIVNLENERVIRIDLSGRETKTYTKNRGGWYAGSNKIKDTTTVNAFLKSLGRLDYEDEYLMLPKDAGREQIIRITCAGASTPFDITVYSKYYVTVGQRIFRINEGDMKILVESLQSLLREDA